MSCSFGVVSPTWMPGTTAFGVPGKLVGAAYVEPSTLSGAVPSVGTPAVVPAFSAIEHLFYLECFKDGSSGYPQLSPNVRNRGLRNTPQQICSETVTPGDCDRWNRDLFANWLYSEFQGLTMRYFVAGIDYYAGRPEMICPIPDAREQCWVDELMLTYVIGNTKVTAPGLVAAERRYNNDCFIVHQVQRFNLHWTRCATGTLCNAPDRPLQDMFCVIRQMIPDEALLYSRAYVYEKAPIEIKIDTSEFCWQQPGPRVHGFGGDNITKVYPLPPLLP